MSRSPARGGSACANVVVLAATTIIGVVDIVGGDVAFMLSLLYTTVSCCFTLDNSDTIAAAVDSVVNVLLLLLDYC